jgi:hypothetical protein
VVAPPTPIRREEGTAFIMQEILASHGLRNQSDYTLKAVGGAPTRWRLLQEGAIDGGLQTVPLNYLAQDAGFSELADASAYVPEYQFTTVNVRSDWAAAHRTQVMAFLKTMMRAGTFGNAGWNTLTGPGLANVDLAITKNTGLGARTVQFRTEVFNVLNRANFGAPDTLVFSGTGTDAAAILPTAGKIFPPTVTTARQIQLGLKVLF